jgi:hypothetical protein
MTFGHRPKRQLPAAAAGGPNPRPDGSTLVRLHGGHHVKLIRVFPRRTKATPDDEFAYVGPPDLFTDQADEVHISVAFTCDLLKAERLAYEWQGIARTILIGGPALGQRSEEFVPGRYIKLGYVITSRGCPRTCWFCDVWKRENDYPKAPPRELPIRDGWNVLDDNLLACSRPHVEAVFAMLRRQGRRVEFTGGLEALSLQDYQVGLLADLKPRPNCFFAYDPQDAFETLQSAARRLLAAGFTRRSHRLRVYVLIGYPGDTFSKAEKRLRDMLAIGFTPHAMLWRPDDKIPAQSRWTPAADWRGFQRRWARPAIIHAAGDNP